MIRSDIFARIETERRRQDAKFPDQWVRFAAADATGTGLVDIGELKSAPSNPARVAAFEMLGILTEEVGEVARAIIERDDAGLTLELVQIAAVVVAWLEGR